MSCNPDLEFVDNFAGVHRIQRLWALGSAVLRFVCGLFFGSCRKIYLHAFDGRRVSNVVQSRFGICG